MSQCFTLVSSSKTSKACSTTLAISITCDDVRLSSLSVLFLRSSVFTEESRMSSEKDFREMPKWPTSASTEALDKPSLLSDIRSNSDRMGCRTILSPPNKLMKLNGSAAFLFFATALICDKFTKCKDKMSQMQIQLLHPHLISLGLMRHFRQAELLHQRRNVHAKAATQTLFQTIPPPNGVAFRPAPGFTGALFGGLLLIGAAQVHPVAVLFQLVVQIVWASDIVMQNGFAYGANQHFFTVLLVHVH